jgi:hypothetical protein
MGYRIEALRPLAVRAEHGPSWREGRAFLTQIVCKRLGIAAAPDAAVSVLDRAAEASGGIPRVFLQLVQDAAFYASIAGREWPDADDLRQSMRDQVSSLRRLLRPGDLATLQSARGTDGLEVDVERRVRFLGHGLLLEYGEAEETRGVPDAAAGRAARAPGGGVSRSNAELGRLVAEGRPLAVFFTPARRTGTTRSKPV